MKAVFCTRYGPPEVLQIRAIPTPKPKENQILVKIFATAVNSGDIKVRSMGVSGFQKILMKFVLGFSKPRNPILGVVFSGIVEEVGYKVSTFKVGDKVFGMTGFKFGTYATYIAVNEHSHVTKMPNNASYEEAAAIVFGGHTAIHFLEKSLKTSKPPSKILIIGATGSVGTSAIQIARHYNADISAICSSVGRQLVKELGVDKITLYDKEEVANQSQQYDIIFDAVGKANRKEFKKLLNTNGIYKSVSSGYASGNVNQLQMLKELFEEGGLNAVIDRVYPMEDIVEAHRYVETGRKKGNVVLKMSK